MTYHSYASLPLYLWFVCLNTHSQTASVPTVDAESLNPTVSENSVKNELGKLKAWKWLQNTQIFRPLWQIKRCNYSSLLIPKYKHVGQLESSKALFFPQAISLSNHLLEGVFIWWGISFLSFLWCSLSLNPGEMSLELTLHFLSPAS